MEDKSLSLWKIPLELKNNNSDNNNFKFGETKMEFYKKYGENNLKTTERRI